MSIPTSKQIAAKLATLDALEDAVRIAFGTLVGRVNALERRVETVERQHAPAAAQPDPEAPAKPKRKRARR